MARMAGPSKAFLNDAGALARDEQRNAFGYVDAADLWREASQGEWKHLPEHIRALAAVIQRFYQFNALDRTGFIHSRETGESRSIEEMQLILRHLSAVDIILERQKFANKWKVAEDSLKEAAAYLAPLLEKWLRRKELRRDVGRIEDDLLDVFKKYSVGEAERASILKELFGKLTGEESTEPARENERPQLPTRAPELYAERADRRENPVAFIKRVYAPWIGNGLDRPAVLRLDKQLYNGLNQWRLRHGSDDLNLPTKSETVSREIEQAGPDALRTARRLVRSADNRR